MARVAACYNPAFRKAKQQSFRSVSFPPRDPLRWVRVGTPKLRRAAQWLLKPT